MLHMVKLIVFFNWILMLFSSQDMLNFFYSNIIKSSKFFKASTYNNENIFENVVSENGENFKIRKSKRIKKERSFNSDFLTYFIERNSQVIVN